MVALTKVDPVGLGQFHPMGVVEALGEDGDAGRLRLPDDVGETRPSPGIVEPDQDWGQRQGR